MNSISKNIDNVRQRIVQAEEKFGRHPGAVKLIAVSKTKPVAALREAIECGQKVFGESYVQEAVEKMAQLGREDIEWHFIGPIQSNKTKHIAMFDWVHSIDREKIAKRLSEQRPESMPPMNICLQLNISDESSKSGVSAADLPALVEAVNKLPNLRLRGLMAIPVNSDDFETQRQSFRKLADLMRDMNKRFALEMDCLSMGMSGDLEAAIAEGATMVRIGTDIFGARD